MQDLKITVFALVVGLLFAIFVLPAKAGGNMPSPGGDANALAISGASAVAGAGAIATASGGTLQAQTGPVTVQGDVYEHRAWGIGAPGLAASANSCQGSVSLLAVGFSYTVRFCEILEKARGMNAAGAGVTAQKAMLCKDEEIEAAYRVAGQPCPK
jgi:hypothetical protein